MFFAFIGISAIPPSGLFITEFLIAKSLFQSSHLLVLILAVLFLTFAIYGMGKNIFALLFTPQEKEVNADKVKIPVAESVSQFILLSLVIYLGFNPPAQLTELISEAVNNLP